MDFTFSWVNMTTVKETVSIDKIDGLKVLYEPSNSDGVVYLKKGEPYIKWDDMEYDTKLDSERGREIIKQCRIMDVCDYEPKCCEE